MVVCKFFLEGRCKFGSNCKNEHPGDQRQQQNSFAPLSNSGGGGGRARSGGVGGGGGGDRYRPGDRDRNQKLPFHLDRDSVAVDLDGGPKGEKPEWLLSSYGPGRDAPRQLLEGPLEQSMQEMRVLYYMAARENKLQDYLQHESVLKAQAQQQAQSILNDLDSALKYVVDGEHQHPNRWDEIVKSSGSPPAAGGFGQPSGGGGNAFGSASTIGGQGSAFGKPSQPGFGQSGFGQAPKPAFGAPSQPAGASPFGAGQQQQTQPNPFAAAASQPSGFAQAGQNEAPQANPFASAGQTNGFGAPSGPVAANPFASKLAAPAFGAPSQPNGSAFVQSASGGGAFGQPSAPSTGVGQPAATSTATGGMDLSSPTQPTTTTNGFGNLGAQVAPAAPVQTTYGAFGGLGLHANSTAPSAPAQTNGTTVLGIPGTTGYTTRGTDGKSLSTWRGLPVTYDREQTPWAPYYTNPQTRKPERIWHPDGIPDRPNPYAEAEPEVYLGELGSVLREVYGYVMEKGEFGDLVPEVPPKREWVRWDL
ncbi:hypothetical protein B0A55_01811 [Friedmanniomyces simplex]|uniref:C3H1-type domain-containing protein n=1 Tax=Friedmanniomyces simplex TaxID=329884 RepID=A0A4U0XW52_9PEZI|nr:hypothetical protein B0A55_01811 [Friedmanniomyces simplex]